MATESATPRYVPQQPLPAYSYVPGLAPHPISDPRGHRYGIVEPPPDTLIEESYLSNASYLYAIDLFNHGYYWEAHEAWEGLWHAAGRVGPTAEFLKGLIKLAAAGVKAREGRAGGVRRHAKRAEELLRRATGTADIMFGLCSSEMISAAASIHAIAERLCAGCLPDAGRMLPLILRFNESSNADARV